MPTMKCGSCGETWETRPIVRGMNESSLTQQKHKPTCPDAAWAREQAARTLREYETRRR